MLNTVSTFRDEAVPLSLGGRRITHASFTQRTIAFHFKPDAQGAAIQTLYEEGDADRGFAIRYLSATDEVTVRAYNGGIYTVNLSMELATAVDGWHQVVVAIHADGFTQLFVDGADPASDYFDGGAMGERLDGAGLGYTNSEDVYDDSAAAKFKGLIDDVRIYDSILTAAQMTALREGRELNTVDAPTLPIPLAHWSMEPAPAISPENRTTIYGYGDNNSGTKQTSKSVYEGPDYSGELGDLLSETTYIYDVVGRMIEVEIDTDGDSNVDETVEYTYDDRGYRVSETTDGDTRTYLYDTQNMTGYAKPIEEYVNDVLDKTYTHGHQIIAQHNHDEDETFTFLHDAHGTTRALIDDSGGIAEVYATTAFGESINGEGLTPIDQARTTLIPADGSRDRTTGFTHQQYRDLAGWRYIVPDPPGYASIKNPITFNTYLYGNANPIYYIDPLGTTSIVELATGIGRSMAIMGLNVTARVAPVAARLYFSLGNAAFRLYAAIPAIQLYSALGFAVLEVGTAMIDNLANNSIPIVETNDPRTARLSRGKLIEQIAGANLRGNVKGIDDFRNGIATSIRSHSTGDVNVLLRAIEADLRELRSAVSGRISGTTFDGRFVDFKPDQIRATQLIVALQQTSQVAQSTTFLRQLQQLSNVYRTTVRPVIVRNWMAR